MDWMKKRKLPFTVLISLLFCSFVANLSAGVPAESKELRVFDVSPGDTLVIENAYGRVRIQAWQKDQVEIRVRSVANDPKKLTDIGLVTQQVGSRIFIQSYFFDYDSESVQFDLSVPSYMSALVSGANTAVEVEGIDGNLRVQTLTGFVVLRNIGGGVNAFSQEGSIDYAALRQPSEDVYLETWTGRIECSIGAGMNFHTRLTAGNGLFWNSEPQPARQPLERQVGGGGPLIHATAHKGALNLRLTTVQSAPAR